MIYHLLEKQEWEKAIQNDMYWPSSLDNEGFIHCSTWEQIIRIGDSLFPKEAQLILLKINSQELESLVVYEDLTESGEMFPHIYGHLNLDAVKSIVEVTRNEAGKLQLINQIDAV
ncbi:DUF952 domain-containing protein [Evansella cellulosilytica]|uniref:DUF952 domain-containing protein n=1 Tax=Evansella cellulosilytica (strain ATCC 21833 / DSM 2522 / FERM P-1141 / JCM 9156 / N-4) TaxID=649639 RepID=E6U0B4_EVAC2|nr:DUF952 domain-containing protein [Evansella cellulosilytica]ADU30230.1 protein of unknown function DUF952 [Evansella cellulosilytica DSM 2522]